MRDFRRIKVWEKGHRLTLAVYEATAGFPREEMYGLTSQVRRSASSIPANIAEGCGRSGDAELARFMLIAMGSASELEYHLLFAHEPRLPRRSEIPRTLRENKGSKAHALALHKQAAPTIS